MVWLIVSITIAAVAGLAIWCGLATAKMVYGYPIGCGLVRRATGRMDESQFLSSDVQELDEAFSRVARSHIVTD